MADETLLKIIANSPTIPQLPEALGIVDDDYIILYSASQGKTVKVKKSNVQFPTTSFVRGETLANFPLSGVLSSLYLESSTNKLYKWTGAVYKWLSEDEFATINAYIATKLDKGTYTGDAVNLLAEAKAYSDSLAQGQKWKTPVDLGTTSNISLSGEQTIDGILTNASRVLVKDQTDASQNGIYTSGATWTRTADADEDTELIKATTKIIQGTQAGKIFTCNSENITLGTTAIVFVTTGDSVNHNSTNGLQGGTTDEFYHLSLANFNKVSALPAVSEATANKAVDFTIVNDTKYPTVKAVSDKFAEEDDVVSEVNETGFPVTGKKGVIYIDETTDFLHLWDEQTSAYKLAGGGGGTSEPVEVNIQYEKVWRTGDSQIFPVADSAKTLNVYSNGSWLSRERRSEDLIIGDSYKILVVGDTVFTALGASANTVGTVFTATGASVDGKTGRVEAEWKVNDATSIIVLIPLDDKDNISIVSSATAVQGASYDDTAIQAEVTDLKNITLIFALSNISGDLTAGDIKGFHCSYPFTLNNYFIEVDPDNPPTGSALVVGMKKNGVSVTSAGAIIDSNEATSLTGTSPTITDNSFIKGDYIKYNLQQVGSLTTGQDLKIHLEITKS